jgi:hypothetical protein
MLSLPIYYTKKYKTKEDKTFLVNLNWYRNAYRYEQNEVKKYYHNLIYNSIYSLDKVTDKYTLEIKVFYKNTSCDGHNIANMFEKFVLDAFQELNIVKQDNVKHHLGTIWSIGGQDKE